MKKTGKREAGFTPINPMKRVCSRCATVSARSWYIVFEGGVETVYCNMCRHLPDVGKEGLVVNERRRKRHRPV